MVQKASTQQMMPAQTHLGPKTSAWKMLVLTTQWEARLE